MQIGLRFGTGSVLVKFQQVYYVLDPELRLIWVGGEWDEFALSNSGSNAIANAVLSTSLLGHISDEPTRRATVQMIEAVQEVQAPLRIDYRCDSPAMLRRFLMTIQPMRDNRVLIVHDLRDARTFDRPLGLWTFDPAAPDCKCSFCCAVSLDEGPYLPPETLGHLHPAEVRLTLCPACVARIAETVLSLREKRQPNIVASGSYGPEASE